MLFSLLTLLLQNASCPFLGIILCLSNAFWDVGPAPSIPVPAGAVAATAATAALMAFPPAVRILRSAWPLLGYHAEQC